MPISHGNLHRPCNRKSSESLVPDLATQTPIDPPKPEALPTGSRLGQDHSLMSLRAGWMARNDRQIQSGSSSYNRRFRAPVGPTMAARFRPRSSSLEEMDLNRIARLSRSGVGRPIVLGNELEGVIGRLIVPLQLSRGQFHLLPGLSLVGNMVQQVADHVQSRPPFVV